MSGVAPRAYLGNYKALTIPTDAGVGLNGNAAEIVAAIEAAVADGMNVINLSIGEPEVEPSRDLVALALEPPRPPASCRSSPPETTSTSSGAARWRLPAVGEGDHGRRGDTERRQGTARSQASAQQARRPCPPG